MRAEVRVALASSCTPAKCLPCNLPLQLDLLMCLVVFRAPPKQNQAQYKWLPSNLLSARMDACRSDVLPSTKDLDCDSVQLQIKHLLVGRACLLIMSV